MKSRSFGSRPEAAAKAASWERDAAGATWARASSEAATSCPPTRANPPRVTIAARSAGPALKVVI